MEDKVSESLKIQDDREFIFDAQVECFRQSHWSAWTLEFTSSITRKLSFTDEDIFKCLTQLRIELAKDGCKVLCNGARLDTYRSGMSCDMGSGLSVEVMSLDPEIDIDYVYIFDYAKPDLIASVEDQFNYYGSRWELSYELNIQHQNGSIIEGIINESMVLEPNKMKFTSPVTPDIEACNENDFECLTIFRIELEKYGYYPLCNGARFDTYTLPIDVDDGGTFVHILTIGEVPTQEDRLYTFGDTEPHLITSIAEQRKNYESWLDSIKSDPRSEAYTV
jgi:hypothetical protein